nr:hypothetical protein [Actinomycetota bacterium]
VIGGGRLAGVAHALGVAEGRVQGPWLLRRLTAGAVASARFVRADAVAHWGPGTVRLSTRADELGPLEGRRS